MSLKNTLNEEENWAIYLSSQNGHKSEWWKLQCSKLARGNRSRVDETSERLLGFI